MAKEALDKLVSIKNGDWEKQFFAVIRLIQENGKLEPVLKVLFLQQVVDVGGQGSESLRSAFAQYKELLSTVPIDTAAPWMDPENEDANRARALAADLIARLPDLRRVGEAAATERRTFAAPLGPTLRWFGWLARNNDSEFQCRRPSTDPASGKLFVLQLSGDGDTVDCTQVGQVDDGTVSLEPHLAAAGVEGRPIYIVDADQIDLQ